VPPAGSAVTDGAPPPAEAPARDEATTPSRSRRSRGRRRAETRWHERHRTALWASFLTAVLAFVPRALTAGNFQTADEPLWMQRSLDFGDALLRLDPAAASSTTERLATMPGVTTMWLGTVARFGWWVGGGLGVVPPDEPFVLSPTAIHLAQLAVGLTTSVLIGLLVLLAWRWAGAVVAVTAGVLLATEPFVVAHGAVLHTDELAALFGTTGALALLSALRLPRPAGDGPQRLAALAGMLLGAAFLTKLSALVLAPGLAVLAAAVGVRDAARAGPPARSALAALRPVAGVLATAAAAALVTVVVAWPAIWADTAHQLRLLRDSAGLAGTGHMTFFLGEITSTPGPLFYLVATPLRMTPWFLVGSLLLAPLALHRTWRAHALAVAVVALPAVVALSTAAKQFDRYVLVVLPLLALAVGMGLDVVVGYARRRLRGPAFLRPAGWVAAAALGAHSAWVAPWGLAYFNPLLGGASTGQRAVLVGWGEGLELAGARIAELEAPACDVVVAVLYYNIGSAFPCGTTTKTPADADYLVLYVNHRQRLPDCELERLRDLGRLVGVVGARGVDYAEIYDVRGGPVTDGPMSVIALRGSLHSPCGED
jgi:hypothetical protein